MAQSRLEELKKLSLPALRHAELVDLAGKESPNKVFEIASSRWPRRQAKAARSLAMVRRDFGQEAFEAFLTSMERVRSEMSETEQAQEKRKMEDRVRQALEQLSDPRKKLQIMVKHGLLEEATAFLLEAVTNMTPYFDWNRGDKNPGELFTAEADPTSPLGGVKLGFHPAGTNLGENRLNIAQNSVLCLDFCGLIKALNWTDEEAKKFAFLVLTRMVSYPINPNYFIWVVEGMMRVVRHYFGFEESLRKEAEKWIALYYFREGAVFEICQRLLPNYKPRTSMREQTLEEITHELDPIVDWMLVIGMTEAEVREEFLRWISEKAERSCRSHFMLSVAGAKCFPHDDADREKLLRRYYLPQMWEELVRRGDVKLFKAFGPLGLWRRKSRGGNTDTEFFRRELIKLLSEGKAGTVFQILVLLGWQLGLCPDFVSNFDEKISHAKKVIATFAPDAYQQAVNSGRFGVAAALALQFNCFNSEYAEQVANTSVREEVATLVGDFVKKDPEELSYILKDGLDSPDEDEENYKEKLAAFEEKSGKLKAIRAKRDAHIADLKELFQRAVRDFIQVAMDLNEPVRLDWMTYFGATNIE